MQAHAPLSAGQADDTQAARFLYLFCCTAEGCGKLPDCWRALRVVVPDSKPAGSSGSPALPPTQQEPPAAAAAAQAPAAAADNWGVGATDDWGVGDSSDWGDGGEAPGAPAAAFDFGDLNAALDAMGSAPAAAKAPAPNKQARATGQALSGSRAAPVYDAARPCLPAFYLYAQPESQCTARSGCGSSSSSSKQSHADQEHLRQLAARYEQEEAAALSAAAAGNGASSAAACAPSVEGGPESWGGEGYEEDTVLALPGGKRARVGAAFFKFTKQLARCPDQCARYR